MLEGTKYIREEQIFVLELENSTRRADQQINKQQYLFWMQCEHKQKTYSKICLLLFIFHPFIVKGFEDSQEFFIIFRLKDKVQNGRKHAIV